MPYEFVNATTQTAIHGPAYKGDVEKQHKEDEPANRGGPQKAANLLPEPAPHAPNLGHSEIHARQAIPKTENQNAQTGLVRLAGRDGKCTDDAANSENDGECDDSFRPVHDDPAVGGDTLFFLLMGLSVQAEAIFAKQCAAYIFDTVPAGSFTALRAGADSVGVRMVETFHGLFWVIFSLLEIIGSARYDSNCVSDVAPLAPFPAGRSSSSVSRF